MANMLKNLDLLRDEPDAWKKSQWEKKHKIANASVEIVKKPRNLEEESKDFHKAQDDITKDVLPAQTRAEDMTMTPQEAFTIVYPNGNPNPQSAATRPLQVELKACNTSEATIGMNLGDLIEQALTQNHNMNTIDMSASIASTKEKKVLNKPFKTPNATASYAVYTKNDKDEVVRVNFNACQASDPNDIGPRWAAKYWGSKVKEAEAKEVALSHLADFYCERVTDPKKDEDWDGKTFYRQTDLLKSAPELVNSKPSYEDETVMNKDANTASSAPVNPARAGEMK